MAGTFLCEMCGDALTDHMTEAWNGCDMAVCDECLAPPAGHACWQELGETHGVADLRVDAQGSGYLVRLRSGATVHFRWHAPLPSRRLG